MKRQDKIMQQIRDYNLTYGITHVSNFNGGIKILMPAFFCEKYEHVYPETIEENHLLDFFFAVYQYNMEKITYNEMCTDVLKVISDCVNRDLARYIDKLFRLYLSNKYENARIRNFIKLINLSTYKRPVRNGEIAC